MSQAVDLRPLKKWLQIGEITQICEEVGISLTQGGRIISGKQSNFVFVNKFMERVEKNKALIAKAAGEALVELSGAIEVAIHKQK